MLKVVLFVVLTTLGHPPQPMQKQTESVADCLAEVRAILESPTITKLPEGGTLQAGCAVQTEPSHPL